MHPAIGALQELQRFDQTISGLQADLATLPKRLRDAESKLNGAKSAVAAAKDAQVQAISQRKKFEFEVDQWKDRAKKYRSQSASVKTNEAYKALQQEISNADAEASSAEDRVLTQMMAIEDAERQVKHFEADLREADQAVQLEKKQIESQYKDEKKRLEEAIAQRALVAKQVPEDLYELYERVSKKHPGTPLAEVRDNQCRACGMRVLPHTIQLLTYEDNDEVFRCETCGRILYTLQVVTTAAPPKSGDDISTENPL